MRTVTVWENDMTDEIDPKILSFVKQKYPHAELKQLSALERRDPEDIFDSLRNSYSIIIQPNMLEKNQVVELAKLISHPLHGNRHSNMRDWDIQTFDFISSFPWLTLNEIVGILKDEKDSVNELCLIKICKACTINFYNFDMTEHYELESDGYWDTKAIRIT